VGYQRRIRTSVFASSVRISSQRAGGAEIYSFDYLKLNVVELAAETSTAAVAFGMRRCRTMNNVSLDAMQQDYP